MGKSLSIQGEKTFISYTSHQPCPRPCPRPARSPSLLRVRAVCPSKSCVLGSSAAVATEGASCAAVLQRCTGCAAVLSCKGGRGLAAGASPPLPPQCRWLDRAVPVPNAHWWLIPMHWDWERLSPSPDRIFFRASPLGSPPRPRRGSSWPCLRLRLCRGAPGRQAPGPGFARALGPSFGACRRSCCALPFSRLFAGRVRAVPSLK